MELSVLAGRMGGLSPRHTEIIALMAQGLNRPTIMRKLGIKEYALNLTVKDLYRSFGIVGSSIGARTRRRLIMDAWKLYQASNPPPVKGDPVRELPISPDTEQAAIAMLHDPQTIRETQIVEVNPDRFKQDCADRIAQGFRPELVMDHQSMIHPERKVEKVIFVMRAT